MSLLAFPPPSASTAAYALQEWQGRVLSGTRAEMETLQRSSFLSAFPRLERATLGRLQHSLSREDVKSAFAYRFGAAANDNKGAEDEATYSSVWPLAQAERAILRMRNGVGGLLGKVVSGGGEHSRATIDILDQYAETANWSHTWIRCVAASPDGTKFAVCQTTDYIRVFTLGHQSKQPPTTLHHAEMKAVAAMQFEPSDNRILAVAAGSKIFLWRITLKTACSKATVQCTQQLQAGASPLSSLAWDPTAPSSLLASSPNANRIYIFDTSTGEHSSVGAWTGGGVTQLVLSPDGTRIAVTYTGSLLRVYDLRTWQDEKWSSMKGRVTAVVWSPSGHCLLYATEQDDRLFAISFELRQETDDFGVSRSRWVGATRAVPLFSVAAIEFDPSEALTAECEMATAAATAPPSTTASWLTSAGDLRATMRLGGHVRYIAISPDGERLTVTFSHHESSTAIALFIVDWRPSVRLLPCGFVECPHVGTPEIVCFLTGFDAGAMLFISWSAGEAQYIPLIYGRSRAAAALSSHPLIDGRTAMRPPGPSSSSSSFPSPIDQQNSRATSADSSLRSGELSPEIISARSPSTPARGEPQLFSQRLGINRNGC